MAGRLFHHLQARPCVDKDDLRFAVEAAWLAVDVVPLGGLILRTNGLFTITPTRRSGPRTTTSFEDAEQFLKARRAAGLQLEVLVEGTYILNRLFATVETIPKTVVDVGSVGVVVSYTGRVGVDLSGPEYAHGATVTTGCRGVWSVPLGPGKYAFNTYAGRVVIVPTTNIILKWIRSETGSHRLDENLSEIGLISSRRSSPSSSRTRPTATAPPPPRGPRSRR